MQLFKCKIRISRPSSVIRAHNRAGPDILWYLNNIIFLPCIFCIFLPCILKKFYPVFFYFFTLYVLNLFTLYFSILLPCIKFWPISPSVLIYDGNSEIYAHVRNNLFYLICLRHLIRSVTHIDYLTCATFLSYHSYISIMVGRNYF